MKSLYKTSTLFVLAVLFLTAQLCAQTNHQYVLIDSSTDAYTGGHIVATALTLDGGLLVVEGSESRQSISFNNGFSLIKYDAAGNRQWNTYLDSGSANNIKMAIPLPDSGYAIVGNRLFASGSYILKTDKAGHFVYMYSYGAGLIDCTFDPSDGGFILTLNGGGNDFSQIVKTNSAGAVVWSDSKNYAVDPDRYIKAKRLANGNYLAVGTAWTVPSLSYSTGLLACYSPTGTLLWSKAYTGPDWVTYFTNFAEQPDGSLLVGGFSSTTNTKGDWPLLSKMDSAGNVLWTKGYGSGTNICYCAFNFSGNSVYINGRIWDTQFGNTPLAEKLDNSGNFDWAHLYPEFVNMLSFGPTSPLTITGDKVSFNSISTFCKTDTALTGTCYNRDTTFTPAAITLTAATITPDTLNRTVLADPYTAITYTNILFYNYDLCQPTGVNNIEAAPAVTVTVYPNPFSTGATIKITDAPTLQHAQLNLYDALGRQVKSIPVTGSEVTLTRNTLQGGIYFYQLQNNGVVIAQNKLVITN